MGVRGPARMSGLIPLTGPALPVERIGMTHPQVYPQFEEDFFPSYMLDAIREAGYIWGYEITDIFSQLSTCPQRKAVIHK